MSTPAGNLKTLRSILLGSPVIAAVIEVLSHREEVEYWVGAGAIAQTVWNSLTNKRPEYCLHDIDIVFFDEQEEESATEETRERELQSALQPLAVPLDVKNQARVHMWYERKFGYPIKPYRDLREAVQTWPTTATAVAVRMDQASGDLKVIAPYGLLDLLSLRVRPNKRQITKEIYEKYVARWSQCWPELRFETWEP